QFSPDRGPRLPLPELPPLNNNLFVIHYSQARADDCPSGSPPVSAIVMQNAFTGDQETFAVFHIMEELAGGGFEIMEEYARLPGGGDSQHAPSELHFEAEALRRFWARVAQLPDATWLHWGMRHPAFGFEVLAQRTRAWNLSPVEIPHERRFDLPHYLKRRFGRDFTGNPNLLCAL